MITGYNDNVRHGGRVFHVQTEDSGRLHPHVITHLFHGGTILVSERCDYAEALGAPDLDARVRQLMEAQHASMLGRLRNGHFDQLIAARLARPAPATEVPQEMVTPVAPGPAPRPPRPPAAPATAPARRARAFGEGVVSDRPLDELILDYLVANARERSGGGRGTRSGS
jgi:hypothetical protein